MHPSIRLLASVIALVTLCLRADLSPVGAAEPASGPVDFVPVMQKYGEQLGAITENRQATGLFVTQIGPALGLQDVATTLAAKNIPLKIATELGVQDLTVSAQRLIAALAAWQLADRVTQALSERTNPGIVPWAALSEWIQAASSLPSLTQATKELMRLSEAASDPPAADYTPLALSAGRLALDAQQRAIAEWWQLKTWKDRVRTVRGRNRLCGTWQWIIHNHQQHHQEQKLSLLFPPPGSDYPLVSGLTEAIVLGENVYLRWESNGQVQEDSLQFTKEGRGLEGTFVNTQGGWGSISGKRTSDCKP